MASRSSTQAGDTTLSTADSKVDLREFVAILRHRIMFIVIPTAVAVLLALIYLAGAPRLYTGDTSILIDARTRPAVGGPADPGSPDAILVESQVKLISSDSVLRRVVDEEGLASDPEFVRTTPGLRSRLMAALGLGSSKELTSDEKAQAAEGNLAAHVAVQRSERTYIADILVTSQDPEKAARLANAVANAYLADQQQARKQAADRDTAWVRDQITTMQAQLQDAEIKAETYKREHGIINANGKLLNEQDLSDAQSQATQAKAKALEIKTRLDQIRQAIASGRGVDALPDALKSPTIDNLKRQYADISRQQATLRQTLGARHPALLESEQQMRDVQRLISEELSRVQAGVANEYQSAQANVVALDKHVQDLKQAATTSNADRVRLDELQRDVDARRSVYDRFLRARDTIREQTVDAAIGRIIAPAAVPSVPTSPKPFAVLAIALAAGLGLGTGLALFSDSMFDGVGPRWPFRTPPSAPATPDRGPPRYRVPLLGLVPSPFGPSANVASRPWLLHRLRVTWPTLRGADAQAVDPEFLAIIQSFGLTEATPAATSMVPASVLVTSAAGSIARTTFTLGLAEAAAAEGHRVIVLDADDRTSLIRDLIAPGSQPGLIDLLGTTRVCYDVAKPFKGSITLVPILPEESRLARRLETQAATRRIEGLAENFDFVLFDGPTIDFAARLKATVGTVGRVALVAPATATRAEIDETVAMLDLPDDCPIVAVLATEPATTARASSVA